MLQIFKPLIFRVILLIDVKVQFMKESIVCERERLLVIRLSRMTSRYGLLK